VCFFQDNKLAISDLRNLFYKINAQEHLKYAVLAADLYQRKGQDFSEEVNSLFVKACVQAKDPHVAVDYFFLRKKRLGAWTTVTSFNRLTEAVLESGTPGNILGVAELLRYKGLYLNRESVELLVKVSKCISDETQLKTFQDNVKSLAKEILSHTDFNSLITW
jgi:hypothetical protein